MRALLRTKMVVNSPKFQSQSSLSQGGILSGGPANRFVDVFAANIDPFYALFEWADTVILKLHARYLIYTPLCTQYQELRRQQSHTALQSHP